MSNSISYDIRPDLKSIHQLEADKDFWLAVIVAAKNKKGHQKGKSAMTK
jgi:hypothetical protein